MRADNAAGAVGSDSSALYYTIRIVYEIAANDVRMAAVASAEELLDAEGTFKRRGISSAMFFAVNSPDLEYPRLESIRPLTKV
jgi:hypothetical protein